MKTSEIQNKKEGEEVSLQGYVHSHRNKGSIIFIELRDVSGIVQVVVEKGEESNVETQNFASLHNIFQKAEKLTLESIISVNGKVQIANTKKEILATEIEVIHSTSGEILPIHVNEKGEAEAEQEHRFDYRWLDLRKPEKLLIFKVKTLFEQACREYFINNSYIEIHTPKLMGHPSESGSEVFEVNYFDRKAYLAQSPQFYKQMAIAGGFEKVFEIGPVFRAENSNTIRHATEYVSMDIEISGIKSYVDVMHEEEKIIVYAMSQLKEKLGKEIFEKFGEEIVIPTTPFPRVNIDEFKKSIGIKDSEEGDMSHADEKLFGEKIKQEFGHDFVFVEKFLHKNRVFHHMKNSENPEYSESADLLYRGMEITTLAQREHRYEILKAQAEERDMKGEGLEKYFEFFKYGCLPHGGFGSGTERFISQLLGLPNVRESMFLFRGPRRLTP